MHRGIWGTAAVNEPSINESSRFIDDALAQYRSAAEEFGKLTNSPKAGTPPYRELFDAQVAIGDILVRQNKHKEALDAYRSAMGDN